MSDEPTLPERALAAAKQVIEGRRVAGDAVYEMASVLVAQNVDFMAMQRLLERYGDDEVARLQRYQEGRAAKRLVTQEEALDWFAEPHLEDWQEAEAKRWISTVCSLYESIAVLEDDLEETYQRRTVAEALAKRKSDGYRPIDVDGERWAWVHDDICAGAVPPVPTYLTDDEIKLLALNG